MNRKTQEKLAATKSTAAAAAKPAASAPPPAAPVPAPVEAAVPASAPAVAAAPAPASVAEPPADARVIVVLAKSNPRRAGTLAGRTFELYRTGMTVAEWRKAVVANKADKGYLTPDARKGYIALLPPGTDTAKWLAAHEAGAVSKSA